MEELMDFNSLITAIITNGIGAACAAAVLWFAWYRETNTIPTMINTFTATIKGVQDSWEGRNNKALELFAAITREERSIYQKWHDENRTRIDQLLAEMKDQRHFLANLANQIGLRQAVEKAQKEHG